MEGWVQTIITVIVSALITAIISGIIGRALKKHYEEKDAEDRVLKEQEEVQRKETIITVLRDEIKPISDTIEKLSDKLEKIGEGTLSSLRNDILTCYYRCREKGYRNDYDFQNMHDLYEAYSGLNGNSFVADVMDRFDKLPTKEEYREEQEELRKRTNKLTPKSVKKKGE